MKQIEKKMIQAVKNHKNFELRNTKVFAFADGSIFVKLYDTIIFAEIKGKKYFSDGGWMTNTTGSRLRALGADYSTNSKKNNCELTDYKKIYGLFTDRLFKNVFGA